MNSNKFIAILGLLLLLLLAIGSISAAEADVDSNGIGDNLANIDLTEYGQAVEEADNDIDSVEEETSSIEDNANDETISNADDAVNDNEEKFVGEKNNLGASNLQSTITFKNSNYNTYFNSSGNITNAVVAPVVVTASSSIWDTTGSRWSFTSRQNYNAATSIMEINGKYIQAQDDNSYVFVFAKRASIQEALNTPQPGNNQSYPSKYGNKWTYNTAVPVKYPGDSGYPY